MDKEKKVCRICKEEVDEIDNQLRCAECRDTAKMFLLGHFSSSFNGNVSKLRSIEIGGGR